MIKNGYSKKNYKKTYNIEFVAEYNVSEISICELKNIINPK